MSNSATGSAPSIDRFDYIQNIGRFETVRGSTDTTLRPLSLIYSENGRGKTTLCATLRSLTSGDPSPILERRRLSATTESKAVVNIAGSEVSFDGTCWSATGPRIAIFDDHFVDANVHSGLNVDAIHRKGVHALVVGEEGVLLQRQVEALTSKISLLQSELRTAEQRIPTSALGSFSVKEFCALQRVENIEQEIEAAKRSLSVLRDGEVIRSTGEFRPVALPSLDEDALTDLLGSDLSDVESAALEAVSQHLSGLGTGAANWVARGLDYLRNAKECPFCGEDVSGSVLISHYRAYFSESYRAHKQRIVEFRHRIASEFSGDRLASLQRALLEERDKREFWARYFEPHTFNIDLDRLAKVWIDIRRELLAALDRKTAAPLERVPLEESVHDALVRFRDFATVVYTLGASLVEQNSLVQQTKEHATAGSAMTAQARLERLLTTERRFRPGVDAACESYLAAKDKKTAAEQEKVRIRTALDKHRNRVFATSETAINRFLDTFNADFTLHKLRPSDARGVPSSTYDVRISNRAVSLNPSSKPSPSFRSTLSAGDRSTLALAFFFASLEQRDISDTIVVIDDPISSLDDARTCATAQAISRLEGRCRQLIVLSHSRNLLCQLWEKADKSNTAALEVRDAGVTSSTLTPWDIEAAAVTEFDRLHREVRNYAESAEGDPQKVAPALRILLESFLRVAFVKHFEPGCQLGHFLQRARHARSNGVPVLHDEAMEELDDLREYANRFHHSTNQWGWLEALSNVNDRELRGYAQRVLRFTTLDGRLNGR